EQVMDGKVYKRAYFMHRSREGRLWAMGAGEESISTEKNSAKRNFMRYIENSRVRADLLKERMLSGDEVGTVSPPIPDGEEAMKLIRYSTASVAYGASLFEISMHPIKNEADIVVLRGPLYAVEESETAIEIDFGRPDRRDLEERSFMVAPLSKEGGMVSEISSARLTINSGVGALRIALTFRGVPSRALTLDFRDIRPNSVMTITPRGVLNPN
ncbi:hypothetical protein OAQ84_01800, partial [Bdellovibrionales bacterium]|nr:hypothetical protein [Bdellovibrionales bacterium]